jgi:CheY-like chemotaxis protein
VRGIVQNHSGALRVYSEVGKGSSFKVLLPASEKVVSKSEAREPESIGHLGGGTVLIVDDEETVRAVTSRALKILGFSVLIATDGREAVAIYREYQAEIRAVLLDMMMPGMPGAATFRQLRQLDPNVRVILMSGYNEQEATNAFAGKGLVAFLQKPFRQLDLRRTLEEVLKN